MRIRYLDGERLRRALIAGCDYVQLQRSELNRINVFPVPDGDTGTNLALTASAISDRLRSTRAAEVGIIARHAAEAAIMGARGNCGMILSHFLLGFAENVGARARLDVAAFAHSLRAAVQHVYRSLERPVEGTIVTVMREVAEEAESPRDPPDFAELIEQLLSRARQALARTPELLPALRAAGVVDAGAKGFVHLMEGVVALARGEPFAALEAVPDFAALPAAAAQAAYPIQSERYRFCTEALVRGDELPESDAVRAELRTRGDSLIVIRGADVLKVHIHTDEPEAVFTYLRELGKLLTHKAEDMAVQHAAVERAAAGHVQLARRPISLVTDSACNLPEEVIRAHGIHVVPLSIIIDGLVLRDGIDLDAAEFVERLRAGQHPTTSQPPPAAFLDAFRSAAEDGETVLGVLLGAALSGTFRSAEAAARQLSDIDIRLLDSKGAALTQGLLVLRAVELAELGWSADRIATELERIRAQSGVFFTVDVFDNLLASGRVGRGKVLIAGLLDIKPILGLDTDGRVLPVASVRGRANVMSRMLALVEERVPRSTSQLRFGIMHVGNAAIAESVNEELTKRYGTRETFIASLSPVLATHLGPDAWGITWQVED
jgi:DegV family protein with EDD domain